MSIVDDLRVHQDKDEDGVYRFRVEPSAGDLVYEDKFTLNVDLSEALETLQRHQDWARGYGGGKKLLDELAQRRRAVLRIDVNRPPYREALVDNIPLEGLEFSGSSPGWVFTEEAKDLHAVAENLHGCHTGRWYPLDPVRYTKV